MKIKKESAPFLKVAYSALDARHVHGVAQRECALRFAALPSLQTWVASGFTHRADPTTGQCTDAHLLSALLARAQPCAIDFNALEQVGPVSSVGAFTVRRAMTKTALMRPIKSFYHQDLA